MEGDRVWTSIPFLSALCNRRRSNEHSHFRNGVNTVPVKHFQSAIRDPQSSLRDTFL